MIPAEKIDRYKRDGYLVGLPVLTPEEIKDLRGRVDHIRENLAEYEPRLYEVEQAWTERPDEVVCHFLGGWLVDEALRALVFDPRITEPAARLLGVERLRFWHDQVFYKPPRHPGVVPWHQDYSYWSRTGPPRHITINILLDDADAESGCMQFVPGSQRWGLLPSLPFDSSLEEIREHLDEQQTAAFQPVLAPLRAGEATVHDSHTLHGSEANTSDRPRRALVFNYMAADTRVLDGGEPLLRNTPVLPEGALIDGPHFPIVLGG
jgi:ectoine hydroxylase-related dioxygenase (phytanoyl-CoA dioxygenase family)